MNNFENVNFEIKKGKVKLLKKGILTLAIANGIAIGGISMLSDCVRCHRTDHRKEYCVLNDYFGLKHQANKLIDYNGCYGKYYEGEPDLDGYVYGKNNIEIISNGGKTYVPFFGELREYVPSGERLEVYVPGPHGESKLVRIFKKK